MVKILVSLVTIMDSVVMIQVSVVTIVISVAMILSSVVIIAVSGSLPWSLRSRLWSVVKIVAS